MKAYKVAVVLGLTALLAVSSGCKRTLHNKATSRTKVVLLGTGSPQTDPERSGPSIAIIVNDVPYLIDFGPGIVRRAAAARALGLSALKDENLTIGFVTHLHSDHTVGYPDLILTSWVAGRTKPLEVYGPSGLAEMTDHILR